MPSACTQAAEDGAAAALVRQCAGQGRQKGLSVCKGLQEAPFSKAQCNLKLTCMSRWGRRHLGCKPQILRCCALLRFTGLQSSLLWASRPVALKLCSQLAMMTSSASAMVLLFVVDTTLLACKHWPCKHDDAMVPSRCCSSGLLGPI